jgi:hypothetical protein
MFSCRDWSLIVAFTNGLLSLPKWQSAVALASVVAPLFFVVITAD